MIVEWGSCGLEISWDGFGFCWGLGGFGSFKQRVMLFMTSVDAIRCHSPSILLKIIFLIDRVIFLTGIVSDDASLKNTTFP